jgi:ribosome-binding protein aMBF1 (putative translation factor)
MRALRCEATCLKSTLQAAATWPVYAQMLLKVCRRKVGRTRPSLPMERRRKAHQSARARLAQHLRAERAARGLSQEQLADLAGLHRTYVGSVEREERNVSLDNIERLAAALGLDISALMQPV